MLWLNKKPRNRRFSRGNVLEVKLRSTQVRAMRTRMAAITLMVVFSVIVGAYVSWRAAQWGLSRMLYENQAFAVQKIDIQTDGEISLDQLRRWANVKSGQNLLALDLHKVKRNLEMVPVIHSVAIERLLPHTLRIRVTERMPIAQVTVPRLKTGGGVELAVYLLDQDGMVMVPLDPRARTVPVNQASDALPSLSGVVPAELQPGRKIESGQVRAALELLAAFDHSPMAGLVDLNKIDVSIPDILVGTTGQGSEVTFGLQDIERQLRRWRGLFDVGQRFNKAIATLDLAVTNNVPTRLLEASTVPVTTAKPAKPLRNKKKHV